MLVYDDADGNVRCTSCNICAKVCPPQCIWMTHAQGPDGKPVHPAGRFLYRHGRLHELRALLASIARSTPSRWTTTSSCPTTSGTRPTSSASRTSWSPASITRRPTRTPGHRPTRSPSAARSRRRRTSGSRRLWPGGQAGPKPADAPRAAPAKVLTIRPGVALAPRSGRPLRCPPRHCPVRLKT